MCTTPITAIAGFLIVTKIFPLYFRPPSMIASVRSNLHGVLSTLIVTPGANLAATHPKP